MKSREKIKSGLPSTEVSSPAIHQRSAADLMAAGNSLRDKVPRKAQGVWKRPSDRAEPLDILRASDAGRLAQLAPIRYGRMLQTPFTFYRGVAAVTAADLAKTPATGIRVQACGDCHLLNFGGFAMSERNIRLDINDVDETLPAPWEWDVKRLVASFVLAARSNSLSDSKGRDAAASCARRYRKHMREYALMNPLEVWYARIDSDDIIALAPNARIKARSRQQIAKAFLQWKEAGKSVLEPYAGRSAYPHHGQRVVMGQRLMQPASDIFLGWVTGTIDGRHGYVRQLRDAKIKPMVKTFDAETLAVYGQACGWALARAHAKAGDAMTISGSLGSKDAFDEAMGDFALAYADQTERDHAALKTALRTGKINVYLA